MSLVPVCSTIVVHVLLIYLNKTGGNLKKCPSFAAIFNKMRNFAVPCTSLSKRCTQIKRVLIYNDLRHPICGTLLNKYDIKIIYFGRRIKIIDYF